MTGVLLRRGEDTKKHTHTEESGVSQRAESGSHVPHSAGLPAATRGWRRQGMIFLQSLQTP